MDLNKIKEILQPYLAADLALVAADDGLLTLQEKREYNKEEIKALKRKLETDLEKAYGRTFKISLLKRGVDASIKDKVHQTLKTLEITAR